jgi:acyl-CoA reductase-like NAD-dependent aldehyde dehydrogenase
VRAGLERFRSQGDTIAREVTLQMGKPIREARREVQTFFERADHMLAIAADTLAPEVLPEKDGLHRRIEHAPLGVVLDVAAWNYPLLIPVNVVVPALLAGNTVLLKHSARTPLCGGHFARAFGDPELPGLIASLDIDHGQTAALVADPHAVDYVAFTGSVAGGRAVYRQAASRVLDVGLELGGKDPAYVAEDADLDFTVENVVDGACYNAGQSCCAVERIYVHRAVFQPFVDAFVDLAKAYRLGNPLEAGTNLGPMVRTAAADTVRAQIAGAVKGGARRLLNLRDKEGTPYLPPEVLVGVHHGMALMTEETFGPAIGIQPVADDEEAIRLMNDSRYGLTASIWTLDRDAALRIGEQVETGTWFMNRCDYLDPALAWTGVKDSGRGCTLSRLGLESFTRPKSFHLKLVP